ncbi:MAG TPA: MFS transporter [Mucilaginibacter sp.]
MYSQKNLSISDALSKSAHPFVFLILILPFGIMTGYLTVTLAYLFTKAGVSFEQIAGLVAASLIPQLFKFIWAPLVDVSLSVKKWYILSTLVSAACILGTCIIPVKIASVPLLTILIIVSNFAVSFVATAVNSLSAYDTPEHLKGRVSGYVQAGNMGGAGVGGGLGLWFTQHLSAVWMAGAILAFICALCCAGLFFVKEPKVTVRVKAMGKTMNNVLKDVWQTVKTQMGLLALIIVLLPTGTCAASTLFAAFAKDWKANADVVALVTGVLGGLITGLGSLAGGWVCDKIDRKLSYLLFGLLQAACAAGMAFFPHTNEMYIIWTLLYSITAGMAYAGYNAVTLEAIGKGAAATKFEVYASISNAPIYIVTFIEGIVYTKWGANGLLNTEALLACASFALFFTLKAILNRRKSVTLAIEQA